jgi:regulator of protease activity HflC (stomatin/prohibitin superfamily)
LNIDPPEDIKRSMEYEVEAERTKRRDILLAEAKKIAQVFRNLSRLMLKLDRECILFN